MEPGLAAVVNSVSKDASSNRSQCTRYIGVLLCAREKCPIRTSGCSRTSTAHVPTDSGPTLERRVSRLDLDFPFLNEPRDTVGERWADLLRLYEKWMRTGSRRNGDLLAEKGIVPNESLVKSSRAIH